MVFTSYIFLFIFLPLFNFFYKLKERLKYKNVTLLISSLIFYWYGEKGLVLILILSGTIDFSLGRLIGLEYCKKDWNKLRARKFLILSLILNLGLLVYFKYSGFFMDIYTTFLSIFGVKSLGYHFDIALPLGISFYTFQSMSYTIDVYKRETQYQRSYLDFMTYISMFPQLVAGPIVRYSEISKQLVKRKVSSHNIEIGIKRFIRGICKKVLIANQMGFFADYIFG